MPATATRTFTVALPDLVLDPANPPQVNPSPGIFGNALAVNWTVKNQGTASAAGGWTDRFFLSKDATLSADDIALGSVDSNPAALDALGTRSNSTSVTLPLSQGLAPGTYYLIVQTDSGNTVVESNEANNTAAVAVPIILPPLPDLTAAGVAGPATWTPGTAATITWTTRNDAAVPATGSWTELVYLSSDAVVGNDVLLAAFNNTGQNLAAHGAVNRTGSVTLPSNIAPGTYYIIVQVDSGDSVVESNETNNFAVAAAPTSVPVVLR